MESTNTFSTRSNAKRNAIKAGVPTEQIEIVPHGKGDDVRFGWRKIDKTLLKNIFPAPAKTKLTVQRKQVSAPTAKREVRNGVKRPGAGGVCRRVWDWLDQHKGATAKDVSAWAESEGLNLNNATIEFYQHRKFHAKAA